MKDFGCFLELGLGFKEEGNLENFSFVEMGKKKIKLQREYFI